MSTGQLPTSGVGNDSSVPSAPPLPFMYPGDVSPSRIISYCPRSHTHTLPFLHHSPLQAPPISSGHAYYASPTTSGHAYYAPPTPAGHNMSNSSLFYLPFQQATPTNYPHTNEYTRNDDSVSFTNQIARPSNLFRTVAPSLPDQLPGSSNTTSLLPGQHSWVAPDISGQSRSTLFGKRKHITSSTLTPNWDAHRSKYKFPRMDDCGSAVGPFQSSHDPVPHSRQSETVTEPGISGNGGESSASSSSSFSSSSSSSSSSSAGSVPSPRRVSLRVQVPLFTGATPTSDEVVSAPCSGPNEGDNRSHDVGTHTVSLDPPEPQLMPTADNASSDTQVVPSQSVAGFVPATQSRGRGFSLSVEISGSESGGSIDLNLAMSELTNSPTSTTTTSSSNSSAPTPATIPSEPSAPYPLSPSPPPLPPSHSLSLSDTTGPSSSGLARDEIIIVDSSDDEDDHTLIMFAPHDPSSHRHSNTGRREAVQMSRDERLARHLQAQFDRELEVSSENHSSSSAAHSFTDLRPQGRLYPDIRGQRRVQGDGHLWSSRGPSGAVTMLPYLPPPDAHHSQPTSSNYRALASHINYITQSDAHRLLQAASLSGHAPSVGGARRRTRFHSNQSLIFNAIMGRPTSYEELLELAERLGPAQSRGLTKEEISRLPSRTHRKKDGDDKSCVVCMSEFQGREKIRSLKPCSHDFHQKCIDRWLKDHNTCPICRERVTPNAS